MAKFIAIDGEADCDGNYILLCDSIGRVLYNPAGISTTEALEFILSLPAKYELVCFGLNYDSNQWLRDIPRATLRHLASSGQCVWRAAYKIEWVPSKMFTVKNGSKSRTVCEVFGFFQTSFLRALQQWGFDPPSEIETMKRKRGSFSQSELQRIVRYCQEECRLLVALMERLQDACAEAGCVPGGRWIGAGAIASALLKRNGVKAVHAYDVDMFGQTLTDEYVLRAYFGGRVELYRQGWHCNAVAHDIRSAYPSAALHLPNLAGAIVERSCSYKPLYPYALWRISWKPKQSPSYNPQVGPFPVRLSHGDICYPASGSGVYHASEVRQAIALQYDVTVYDGLLIIPQSGERSFTWIKDVYAVRERYKRDGNRAEKALKLGLNSVYGKMAQGYGFGRRPPFQSYYWAGFITAATRAQALRMLNSVDTPVMCATDGIVAADDDYKWTDRGGIGSWERTRYDRIATIQPGVYVAEKDGERIVKSRGFFARDVDYDALIDRFYDDPLSCYHFTSRRFIGLKVALHRKDFGIWRQWIDEKRSIAFEIRHKRREEVDNGGVSLYPLSGPYDSLPYVPKQSLYDDPSDTELENMIRDDQPHREVD